MRLICPNCDAQYEVDDGVIPEPGRDVQCSNCGHTWFQLPPHLDKDLADDLEEAPPGDAGFEDADTDEPDERPGGKDAPEPRGLDPDVADVLRAEAERETKARKAEADGLETQPDLGLEDADEVAAQRSAAARARMARLRGIDDGTEADPADVAAAAGSRRELLPDIDEINSTLRASDDREAGDGEDEGLTGAEDAKQKRGRFRTGLFLIVLLAAIAVAVYALAPRIIELAPQTEPYLTAYVAWMNGLRDQLNTGIGATIAKINELIAGFTGGGDG